MPIWFACPCLSAVLTSISRFQFEISQRDILVSFCIRTAFQMKGLSNNKGLILPLKSHKSSTWLFLFVWWNQAKALMIFNAKFGSENSCSINYSVKSPRRRLLCEIANATYVSVVFKWFIWRIYVGCACKRRIWTYVHWLVILQLTKLIFLNLFPDDVKKFRLKTPRK